MRDLMIDGAVPDNVKELILRAVKAVRPCVADDDREHVAFLVSQYVQQAYWMGCTDGMKSERKLWRKQ
jgi:hypothetical protein